MSVLGKHTYRIAVDNQKSIKYWTDYETGDPFVFPSGVSMQIQIGIREDKKTDTFYEVPAGTVLKLELKDPKKNGDPPDADDPAYMPQEFTVTSLTSLSTADWQAGTSQHATFDYAAADTALPVGTYWMVISGVLSDGSLISPNFAKMEVVQDGTGPETTVAPVPPAGYDAATMDALLALKQGIIALNVVDPTVTGVAADLHTEGYTNETPPRYFKKTGAGDTDWESMAVSENGVFLLSWVLGDSSGVSLPANSVSRIGSQLVFGDNLKEGGHASTGFYSTSTIEVRPTGSPSQNGDALVAAYDAAKLLTPSGSALSVNNRASLIIYPGEYNLSSDLAINTDHIDILTAAHMSNNLRTPVFISGSDVIFTASNLIVNGMTFSATSRPLIEGDLPNQLFIGCVGVPTGSFGSATSGGIVSGTFVDCRVSSSGFALGGTASGTFIDCSSGSGGFGSYGYSTSGEASGEFLRCTSGQASFGAGGTASGRFVDCVGTSLCFGGADAGFSVYGTASGEFIRCEATSFSFGYFGAATGIFRDCLAENTAWGADAPSPNISGKFYRCNQKTGTFPTPTGAGKFRLCIEEATSTEINLG